MTGYQIIIEKGKNNLSAYAPDLPGCIATAKSESELIGLMEKGIELHLKDMKDRGYKVPKPKTKAKTVSVAA